MFNIVAIGLPYISIPFLWGASCLYPFGKHGFLGARYLELCVMMAISIGIVLLLVRYLIKKICLVSWISLWIGMVESMIGLIPVLWKFFPSILWESMIKYTTLGVLGYQLLFIIYIVLVVKKIKMRY